MSAKKNKRQVVNNSSATAVQPATPWLHTALVHLLGWLGVLITVSFFTATYDTAQVKLTLLHVGACAALGLWGALKISQRQNPFSRAKLPYLLPLLVYAAWNILAYLLAPYHWEASEEFIRFLLYTALTLLAADEFTVNDTKTFTRYIVGAAVISFGYALIQITDIYVNGFDPMPWRAWFGKRIFSTHANPNFFGDFIIFASCLTAAYCLLTRKKWLVGVLGAGLIALFFTESKGAWAAYAAAGVIGTLLCTNYIPGSWKKYRRAINLSAAVLFLAAVCLVGVYSAKRFSSVSFRAYTWLSAFEMVQDKPIIGVGTGNFKTIYSAYRRPQIFFLENSHNTETQHAENELLEQWAVCGTVGLACYLWLIGFIFILAVRRLKQTAQMQNAREHTLLLTGYLTAFAAMTLHSLVDVSIRFASSGYFFALFMGILLALGKPENEISPVKTSANVPWYSWLLRGVVACTFLGGTYWVLTHFYELARVLSARTAGDFILAAAAWMVLLFVLLGLSYIYMRACKTCTSVWALILLELSLLPMFGAYALFQANHYYNLGITLINNQNPQAAVGFFTRAIRYNPLQAEYLQFRGNLLTTLLDLTKTFSPNRGDTDAASDDFTRALRDFNEVQRRTPNHPLLYLNRGQLHYMMALRRNEQIRRAHSLAEYEWGKGEALSNMALAKEAFARSLVTDPVNAQTYAYLAQIALLENDLTTAQNWLDAYRRVVLAYTEGEQRQTYLQNATLLALQQQVNLRKQRPIVAR